MTAQLSDDLRRRLKRVRLLSLDTDGVLTDGGIYFTDAGDELRKFNVKDGLGIQRAQAAGIIVVMMTSSVAPAIAHRGKALGVDHIFLELPGVGIAHPCSWCRATSERIFVGYIVRLPLGLPVPGAAWSFYCPTCIDGVRRPA